MKMNIFFTIFFSTMSILLADPPNWEGCPGCYEFTSVMNALVFNGDDEQSDVDDILADNRYKLTITDILLKLT